jgi:hypothetical protein
LLDMAQLVALASRHAGSLASAVVRDAVHRHGRGRVRWLVGKRSRKSAGPGHSRARGVGRTERAARGDRAGADRERERDAAGS